MTIPTRDAATGSALGPRRRALADARAKPRSWYEDSPMLRFSTRQDSFDDAYGHGNVGTLDVPGIPDVERLARRCGQGVVRLRGPWNRLASLLPTLGHVRILAGLARWEDGTLAAFVNPGAGATPKPTVCTVLDADTLARRWRHGFAVVEETCGLMFCSLQFFDAYGAAAHKLYLTDDSDVLAWSRLVGCLRDPFQFMDVGLTVVNGAQ